MAIAASDLAIQELKMRTGSLLVGSSAKTTA